jgi:MtaA/CmuA family methyltransferase
MNGYQRTKAAIEGFMPDRRPIMLHNFMMAAREAGFTMKQFREDPSVIAKSFIQAVETYNYDAILVDVDTATLAGAVGVPVDFPDDQPALSHAGSLPELAAVKDLEPVNIAEYRYVHNWIEAVRLLKEYFGDEIYLRANCDQAPFALASMIRTPQQWFMDLIMDEESAHELLQYCTDVSCQFIRLMADTKCHMVSNGDSPAGPEMISPAMYRKFALPYQKRVVDEAHQHRLAYTLHICGNTEAILSDMVETGADCLELDYKTDVRKIYDLCNKSVCFIGNIDPSGILALGTVGQVEKAVCELLEVYKKSPRFILNAGCAIPAETPSENIKAMIQMVCN